MASAGQVAGEVAEVGLGIAKDAATGVAAASIASTIVGVGTAVAAYTASSVAAAGTAIAIGGAIGNAIPIPGIGAAIGACIGALVAFGDWLGSATEDTFHPTPQQAAAWLVLFHIDPATMWAKGGGETVDNAWTPDQVARLIRYFRIVSGMVKTGEKGNTGDLYNPVSNDSCDNPYMCQVDPSDPLTDPAFLAKIQTQTQNGTSAVIPTPTVTTPESAIATLQILRSAPSAFSGILNNWSQLQGQTKILDQINQEIKDLRLAAGESGPDPILTPVFGDVTVAQQPGYTYMIGKGFVKNPPPPAPPAPSPLAAHPLWYIGAAALVGGVAIAALAVEEQNKLPKLTS